MDEIIEDAVLASVEGLTLIGGEPFDQPDSGYALAKTAREAGLGVIVFSGFEYEVIRDRGKSTRAFLGTIDLLVDGPYQEWNPDKERALVGSGNQRFIHLTDRYKNYRPEVVSNRVDVRVRPDGIIEVAGFLDSGSLKELGEITNANRTRRRF